MSNRLINKHHKAGLVVIFNSLIYNYYKIVCKVFCKSVSCVDNLQVYFHYFALILYQNKL